MDTGMSSTSERQLGREPTRVQSVERAAALLRAVAAATGPAGSATALAEAAGLNRTTTWRILTTLEQQRLVAYDRETGTYSLGFGLIDLAGQAGGAALVRRPAWSCSTWPPRPARPLPWRWSGAAC